MDYFILLNQDFFWKFKDKKCSLTDVSHLTSFFFENWKMIFLFCGNPILAQTEQNRQIYSWIFIGFMLIRKTSNNYVFIKFIMVKDLDILWKHKSTPTDGILANSNKKKCTSHWSFSSKAHSSQKDLMSLCCRRI